MYIVSTLILFSPITNEWVEKKVRERRGSKIPSPVLSSILEVQMYKEVSLNIPSAWKA